MPWLRSSANKVQTNVFCCCLIVNYGVALHRTCYTIVCRNRHGIFWGLIFGPGIFFEFCRKPYGFFWVLSFGSIRSSPSLEILSTPLGDKYEKSWEKLCGRKIRGAQTIRRREEIVVLNYIYHGSIRHLDFLFAQKLMMGKKRVDKWERCKTDLDEEILTWGRNEGLNKAESLMRNANVTRSGLQSQILKRKLGKD